MIANCTVIYGFVVLDTCGEHLNQFLLELMGHFPLIWFHFISVSIISPSSTS